MKKFEGILLATDLDGTLLRDDKSVSEENRLAIEYFKENGGRFTFITGRTPMAVASLCKTVTPNAPIGCMNGAGIYDYDKDQLLWSVTIPDSVKELVQYVDLEFPNTGIEVITRTQVIFCKENAVTDKHVKDEGYPYVVGNYHNINEPMVKILFADSPQTIDLLSKEILKHPRINEFAHMRSDAVYYELLPLGLSKATLIKKIPEFIDAKITKTVAIGDNDNDAEMLKVADIGYAVANASPAAKKNADIITVSNEEDAIAKVIYSL